MQANTVLGVYSCCWLELVSFVPLNFDLTHRRRKQGARGQSPPLYFLV